MDNVDDAHCRWQRGGEQKDPGGYAYMAALIQQIGDEKRGHGQQGIDRSNRPLPFGDSIEKGDPDGREQKYFQQLPAPCELKVGNRAAGEPMKHGESRRRCNFPRGGSPKMRTANLKNSVMKINR